jgi:hypothetical protein
MNSIKIIKLDYGNCEIVRFRGKEACVKDMSLRTETVYKAGNVDELAPHSKVFCSTLKVKTGVVYPNNMLLPGEASVRGLNGIKATGKVQASVTAMLQTSQTEESAEGEVVASEPVSSCVSLIRGEEYGKAMRSKARSEEEKTTGGAL